MFVRKRVIKLKNGGTSEIYQAVVAYRKNGKVRQEVIALGKHLSPETVLQEWRQRLEMLERNLNIPVNEYKEIKYSRLFNTLMVSYLPVKIAEKRRMKLMKQYEKLKSKYVKLKNM